MPKARKSSTSDSDSGPNDQNPPPAKKTKVSSNDKQNCKDSGDRNYWVLEKQRQVRINEFRGRKLIDIREYFEKNGESLPGKKGISLTVDQWKKLLAIAEEINRAIE